MKAFLRNLWGGVKLTFLLPCEREIFTFSFVQLWAIVFFGLLVTCGLDFLMTEPPREFNHYAFRNEGFYLAMLLFGAFLTAQLFRKETIQLDLTIVALNVLCISFAANSLFYHYAPDHWVESDKGYRFYTVIFWVWMFVILFRTVLMVSGIQPWRQLLATFLLLFTLVIPNWVFYSDYFWYHKEPSSAKSRKVNAEQAFSAQPELMRRALQSIEPRREGRNLFAIAAATWGEQDVFMKEARLAREQFDKHLGTKGHSLLLVNNRKTLEELPMATFTNLETAVNALGKRADKNQDALLLFLTSHGSEQNGAEVYFGDIEFYTISPDRLKKLLDASPFKWRILIVSACYAGTYIEPLKNDNTLIITASRKDRTSFGCDDAAELTYFGEAFLKDGLKKGRSLEKSFEIAKERVTAREKAEKIEPASEPQIWVGSKIKAYLK